MIWLTSEQLLAVDTEAPVAVVRAAPGSGKTTVLTERIRTLLTRGVPPERILALTFTRRAALELAERCPVTALTFHAFAVSLIVEHGSMPDFVIRDQDEVATLTRAVREELGKRALDDLVDARVRARLLALKSLSYDEVEIQGIALAHRSGITHVLIDEAQDTSERQQVFVRAIGASSEFWCGDWGQSIYGFRRPPANPEGFVELCASGTVYDLTLNQRSGAAIAAAGSRLAARMTPPGMVQRTLEARGAGSVACASSLDVEDFPPGDCAVLCRTRDDVSRVEHELVLAGLPVIVGGQGPWTTDEARQLIAAIRLRRDPHDHLSLGTLGRGNGISAMDVAKIVRAAASDGTVREHACRLSRRIREWMEMEIPELIAALRVPLDLAGLTGEEILDLHAEQYSLGLPPQGDAVLVTTVHFAKGAEFPNVWVVGFDRDVREKDVEEQRRLLYVATTRARDRVRWVVRDEMGSLLRECAA